MENLVKKSNSGLILLTVTLAIFTWSCGKSMSSRSYSEEASQDSEYVKVDRSYPLAQKLSWMNENVELVSQTRKFDIRFSEFAKTLNRAEQLMRALAWGISDCAKINTSEDQRPADKKYLCNELPFGQIQSSQSKLLDSFVFQPMSGQQGDVTYSVSGATIPIRMDRYQRRGSDKLPLLSHKGESWIDIHEDLLRNSFYRLNVDGGKLITDFCLFLPGMTFSSDKNDIFVSVKKKVLFFSLKGTGDVDIVPGNLSFSQGQVCASFVHEIDQEGYRAKFNRMSIPEFQNLAHKGLDVKIDVNLKGILGFISNLLKIIGIDIEKRIQTIAERKIEEAADEKFQEIKKEDINTGEWLVKYVNAGLFKGKIVADFEKGYQQASGENNLGSGIYLDSFVEAGCVIMARAQPKALRSQLEQLCRKSFAIKVNLFVDSQEDRDKGCYSQFFTNRNYAMDEQMSWWKKDCKIRSQIELVAPADMAPFYSCLTEVLSRNPQELLADGTCANELADLEDQLGLPEFEERLDQIQDLPTSDEIKTRIQERIRDLLPGIDSL